MAQSTKEAVAEKIEIVDQPEEFEERGGLNFKFIIPAVVVAAAVAFLVVRRILSSRDN